MNDQQRELRLKRLKDKGLELATKLAEIKAGKDVRLSNLNPYKEDPIINKEILLRRYLDKVVAAQKRFNAGTYGKCVACGSDFSDPVLDEYPWVELCQKCDRD